MEDGEKKSEPNISLPFREAGGEKLLQFIWQFGYYNAANLHTTAGETLLVIFSGTLNRNSGPDFSGAKIRIGETTFYGNVELHLSTSDWIKHHHQSDTNYGNVILHVVFRHDKDLNHSIPVLELEPRIATLLLDRYFDMMNAATFIPCSTMVSNVTPLVWMAWKERLVAERLVRKAAYILSLLEQKNYHWEEVLWWLTARSFGMKVNGDAFEAIARSVALNVLLRHKASIHQIEAILFGQSGLLNDSFDHEYPKMLQREYNFLQKKLLLHPAALPLQFMRMRPGAFPTVRLAQLAVFIQQSSHLFARMLDANSVLELKPLFAVTANDFWHYHYTLKQPSVFKEKTLGADAVENILINTVIPVLFAYGLHHKEESHKEKAIQWLEELNVEKNTITKGFAQLGVKAATAHDSQALIELKNEYCTPKKCLDCAVGNALLKKDFALAKIDLTQRNNS
jgi:hypothetical protein